MPGGTPWEEPKPGPVAVVHPDGSSQQVVAEAGASDGVVLTTRVDVPHAGRP